MVQRGHGRAQHNTVYHGHSKGLNHAGEYLKVHEHPLIEDAGPHPPSPPEEYSPHSPPPEEYGPPSPLVEEYGPPPPTPAEYGPPPLPVQSGPPLQVEYGPPQPPAGDFGPPLEIADEYGPPHSAPEEYGPPLPALEEYGPPPPFPEEYRPPPAHQEEYGPTPPLLEEHEPLVVHNYIPHHAFTRFVNLGPGHHKHVPVHHDIAHGQHEAVHAPAYHAQTPPPKYFVFEHTPYVHPPAPKSYIPSPPPTTKPYAPPPPPPAPKSYAPPPLLPAPKQHTITYAPAYLYPDDPPVYSYSYSVDDDYTGAVMNVDEARDEYNTHGSYQVSTTLMGHTR